ncbi:Fic/DOC family protein [Rubeoparvulum massiliense]|uniref:Fic/DOC family protein n=1 Tax=Rubeoparvulum massiliense TaxID=1631346 RepID=UPI00065E6A7C|nr:Fic family protein [Rubeoparvulum massiliense]
MGKYNPENQDAYLLKHNFFGATSYDELEQLEAVAFSIRASQLESKGFVWLHPLSIDTLKRLHYFLFQDAYPFAGKIRDVQLMKGQTRFCQVEFIESNLYELILQLQGESVWKSIEQASERLAYYKSELNMIHPFREGNGRTIRLVIREIARSQGYDWDFQKIDRHYYMKAMIQSVVDESLLRKLLNETLSKNLTSNG